jgi:hypothetical protein
MCDAISRIDDAKKINRIVLDLIQTALEIVFVYFHSSWNTNLG